MRVQFYLLNRASPSLLVLHGHESDACGGEEVECVHEGRPHDAEGGVDAVGDHGLDEGLGVGHEVGAHGRRSGGVVVVVILGDSDGLGQLGRRRRRRPHCGPGFNTNSDKEARKSVHVFFPKIVDEYAIYRIVPWHGPRRPAKARNLRADFIVVVVVACS